MNLPSSLSQAFIVMIPQIDNEQPTLYEVQCLTDLPTCGLVRTCAGVGSRGLVAPMEVGAYILSVGQKSHLLLIRIHDVYRI